jgi:hypothetical protein
MEISATSQNPQGQAYNLHPQDKSIPQTPQAAVSSSSSANSQAQGIIIGVNYIANSIKDYLDSDPPFFPAGHPSRPDMIKQIRSLDSIVKKSSIDLNLKQSVSGNTLADNANDQDISNALGKLYSLRDTLIQRTGPVSPSTSGNVVNVKV